MKLIPLDAVLAEIEILYQQHSSKEYIDEAGCVLDKLEDIINSLEVKEVDLDKAIKDYMDIHRLHIKDGGRIVFENNDSPNFMCDFRDFAKHFFELGLKAQKGEKV